MGLVRAGSGFYAGEILGALEERGIHCIIAAKACANLKHEIYGLKDWVEKSAPASPSKNGGTSPPTPRPKPAATSWCASR